MMKGMWRQAMWAGALTAAALVMIPAGAEAQIVRVNRGEARQTVGLNLGYFALRALDARADQDIIFVNVSGGAFGEPGTLKPLSVQDFNGFTFGGEWLFRASDFVEVGAGVGYYQHSVPTAYIDYQNTNGSEITQTFKLRTIPLTFTGRFLPLGRNHAVEPYVGGGLGVFNWRYTETGQFIDFAEGGTIFPGTFEADGNAIGGVILGGVRVPLGDALLVGGELRYQRASGDIDRVTTSIPADKIDLSGWNSSFTLSVRF